MASAPSLLMVGCGNMGSAMLSGWLRAGILRQYPSIHIVKPSAVDAAQKMDGVTYHTRLQDVGATPDVVVLAVKPAKIAEMLKECGAQYGAKPIYVSVAAGITRMALEAALNVADAKVVRAMPNTPVAINKGITGLCASKALDAPARDVVQKLFAALGEAVWIEESHMDAFTALAGSGPAYLYYFAECVAAAAAGLGLEASIADRITRHMLLGASALACESDATLADLRRAVTSPNGTTEAALNIWMQKNTLDAQAEEALKAAVSRAAELSANA